MKNKTALLVGLGLIVLLTAVVLAVYFPLSKSQPVIEEPLRETTEELEKNEVLREVSFCGEVYKTNGAMIDGVEVVERIAQIASANPSDYVCDNINTNQSNKDFLEAQLRPDEANEGYYLSIQSQFHIVDGKIYKLSGFDGTESYYGDL